MELPLDLPPQGKSQVYRVSDITQMVRMLLEEGVGTVRVEGEISNHRRQASGHQYFTLKDERSQLACVLFQKQAMFTRAPKLADGMQVQVEGRLTVYEARGQYQLMVDRVHAAGAGLLQARFEALKQKLAAEGLFDREHKKPLPRFPIAIGVVTSPTGAAIQDMLNVLHRRAPWVHIYVNPVRVQGEGAAREIARAVLEFDRAPENGYPAVDVIVVCRGGGSAEDLWEFNEEELARAIFACCTPVVSAVGHEIDFTISDFVADLRAPTPSAAAELVVPDSVELERHIAHCRSILEREVRNCLKHQQSRLAGAARAALFQEPRRRLQQITQDIDRLADMLDRCSRAALDRKAKSVQHAAAVLKQHRPDQVFAIQRGRLSEILLRLRESAKRRVELSRNKLAHQSDVLRLLSPEGTLRRGYSVTLTAEGKLVKSVQDVASGDGLETRVADGNIKSVVAS